MCQEVLSPESKYCESHRVMSTSQDSVFSSPLPDCTRIHGWNYNFEIIIFSWKMFLAPSPMSPSFQIGLTSLDN